MEGAAESKHCPGLGKCMRRANKTEIKQKCIEEKRVVTQNGLRMLWAESRFPNLFQWAGPAAVRLGAQD